MRVEKRLWIYAGLAVPEGVGFARRVVPHRSLARRRILLVGDRYAEGIIPPLAQLADGAGASLRIDLKSGAEARDWAKNGWLSAHLSIFCPTVVLLALDPRDMLASRRLRAKITGARAEEFWMVPPSVPWLTSPRFISIPRRSVEGHAAWAGRAWTMLN